jgi:hypothetical protein
MTYSPGSLKHILYYGTDEPPPARTALRAGPLSLIWENGDLRYIGLGQREVLRRLYVALRDRDWGTVPNSMSNLAIHAEPDAFHITYDVVNRAGEIDFVWQGEIVGSTDGTIRATLDGVARTTFLKNRIGFCILHPAESAGAPARVEHVNGTLEAGILPIHLSPDQPVQPFAEMRRLSHEVEPGVWAELTFEGDVFEMEDQRNWTDASFKTFSTPLRLPFPVELQAGTRVRQSVTLRLRDERAAPRVFAVGEAPELTFAVDSTAATVALPPIGLGAASHGAQLTRREIGRLHTLNLGHLRVDLALAQDGYETDLRRASAEADALGAPLEIALFVSPERVEQELARFRAVLDAIRPRVTRFLIYPTREMFRGGTPFEAVLDATRRRLAGYSGAALVAGTNADFIFLARNLPPRDGLSALTFAITPQVHAFDNASLAETLATQAAAVASARRLARDLPVIVSPVTLKLRHNPYATGPVPSVPPSALPPQVDPRQVSLFAAGWTAGSLKYLALGGASSITYYETTGWRGVMEREGGSPLPDQFRSLPGAVFPIYHVLADAGEFAGGDVLTARSSAALRVDGIALRKAGRSAVILANLTAEPQRVTVVGVQGKPWVRMLDETNAEQAMRAPEVFRASPGEQRPVEDGRLALDLLPYAVARVGG